MFNRRLHHEAGMGPVICGICDYQLRLYGHLDRFPVDNPAHRVVSIGGSWEDLGRPDWRLAIRDPRGLKRRMDAALCPCRSQPFDDDIYIYIPLVSGVHGNHGDDLR